jgi:phage head maturation protease
MNQTEIARETAILRQVCAEARRQIRKAAFIADPVDGRRSAEQAHTAFAAARHRLEDLLMLEGKFATAVLHNHPLQIKTIDSAERIVEGYATTESEDFVGDRVLAAGAEGRVPHPLLVDHNPAQPCGRVLEARPDRTGIWVVAQIAKVAVRGELQTLLDRTWQEIVAGLRRGLSIGFRSLDAEPLATGGTLHRRWKWAETSIVVLPCAVGAEIAVTRAIPRRLPHYFAPVSMTTSAPA